MRLGLGLIVLAVWPSLANAAVPAADALWQKGDYRGAFAQAIEPATRGDARAQFLIGEAYRLGRSVDPNFPLAQDWYARAARQGNVSAATELGLLLASQHLDQAALPWLTMAAQHGEPRALCSLAALYYNGRGISRDEPLAYALMSRAAQSGLPEAKLRLATLHTLLSPETQHRGDALIGRAIPDVPLPPAPAATRAPALHDALRPTIATTSALAVRAVRIQVGAYRSAAAAEQAWSQLVRRVAGLHATDHAVVRAGTVFRLQARLRDRNAADDFRRRLEAAGWQHFIRKGTDWA